ncbi:MAG: 6-phosphogluconolactonase, partial [Oscillospiraceae bacterium]|nr:6-phosphogluconolactonase [Oscillospiraceae bacterium]
MKVIVTKDYTASCRVAADMIIAQLKADPESKLGLATGGTVVPIYEMLAAAVKAGEVSFAKACSVNLDEYVGLDPAHPQSYRYFMDENLFNKVDIDKSRTFVASGVGDEEETLRVFKAKLEEGRPIDIQLLGIGVDGHIGF